MHTGSCLCGAVSFTVEGELPGPDACHCSECRKFSGHYFVSTDVPRSAVTIQGTERVRWYQTGKARRGFCEVCGSSLFWDPPAEVGWIGIAMGAFDAPTDTRLRIHIYVANKGDYYDISDDVPQKQQH